MKIIDISWPISEKMTAYKDVRSIKLNHTKNIEKDGVSEWLVSMSNHTGTHVDGPAHFLSDGKTVDNVDLSKLVGPCRVLDCTSFSERITANDLTSFNIKAGEIILCKTTNSLKNVNDPFLYNFVYLDHSAAQYLVSRNIKAIGIDYLGIERNQPDHETHKAFMYLDIPIIEGLRLGQVTPRGYFLCCLPLSIGGVDSAPARAILIENIAI